MSHSIRTLLWLQTRLLRNAFRRKDAQDTGRLVGVILLTALMLPGILVASAGAAIGLRLLDDPVLAAGGISLGLTFLLFIWLATPASNQQLVEPLRLSRLVVQPISFRDLALGSFLVNSVGLGTVMTAPLLVAVVIGTAPGLLQVVPIAISAMALMLVFLVVKALIDDIMDLVAEDRRLRVLIITISILPFLLLYFAQFAISFGFENGEPDISMETVRQVATWMRWIPPAGWFAESVFGAMTGAWGRWLVGFAALVVFGVGGLALHVRLMRRLFFGNFLRSGTQVMKATTLRDPRPLPFLSPDSASDLQALLRKDWLSFKRNPMAARLIFMPILIVVLTFFMAGIEEIPLPAFALGLGFMAAYMVTMTFHNQIATFDHLGVGSLLLSPAPRHLILLSQAVLNLALVLALTLLGGAVILIRSGDITAFFIALASALLFQIPLNGLCHLTSIVFPYRVELDRGSAAANEARQSLFTVFSVLIGLPILAAPLGAGLVIAYLFARPWLPLGIIAAVIYAVGVYAALLHLANHLFPRREEALFERIVAER